MSDTPLKALALRISDLLRKRMPWLSVEFYVNPLSTEIAVLIAEYAAGYTMEPAQTSHNSESAQCQHNFQESIMIDETTHRKIVELNNEINRWKDLYNQEKYKNEILEKAFDVQFRKLPPRDNDGDLPIE